MPRHPYDHLGTPEQVIVAAESGLHRFSFAPSSCWVVAAWRSSADEPALRYLASHDSELLFSRGPLPIDRFLDAAIEIDVDALYDGESSS